MERPGRFHRILQDWRVAEVFRSGPKWAGYVPTPPPGHDIWVYAEKADEAMRLIDATLALQVTE